MSKTNMSEEQSKTPFFVRFLETQDRTSGPKLDFWTFKYPSDKEDDGPVTQKYPSDSDEGV